MNRSHLLIAAAALSLALPALASAQPPHMDLHDREDAIAARIDRAEHDGRLKPHEARDLRTDLVDIRQSQERAEHRGIKPHEREKLNDRLDNLSGRIHDDTH
jgi:hypothetical protein